jgi:glycosyltransferase involved in cell wall biosynthesis
MKTQSAAVYTYERIIASLEAYRLFNPMTHANLQINRGIVDGEFSTAAIKDSDIVVFQREFPSNLSSYLAVTAQAANLGKPVVMDMDDDLLALPIHHPDRVKLNYAKAQIPILLGMVQAKALTVTTPYLADRLRKYNTNIFVLPNFLDDTLWQFNAPQVEPVSDKIRIFYMGTVTHVPDLEMLKPAFRGLAMKYPGQLEFVFYGANLEFEEDIPAIVTNCQSETFVYADYVKVALSQKANIAIAPVEDIPYNHCKSSIKFFEYSAMGLPGVYSRVTPYSLVVEEGINGFTASTIDEWIDALSRLIENSQLREKVTLAAQETVRRDWLLSDHAHLWPETYAEIVELKTVNQAPLAAYLPVLKDINLHLDTFFKKQEQKNSELSWYLSEKAQALTMKSEENAELNLLLQQANQALTAKSEENAEMVLHLEQANQALTAKSEENAEMVLHLEQANQALTAKSLGESELKQKLKQADEALAAKAEENVELKAQVDNLSVQWLDHTKLIQNLESENRVIRDGWDATKLETVHYALSRSWRLTRPMRKFIKFFKGK